MHTRITSLALTGALTLACGGDDGGTSSSNGTSSDATGGTCDTACGTESDTTASTGGGSSGTGGSGGGTDSATTGGSGSTGGAAGPHLFFINFDGVALTAGPDDATMNTSQISGEVFEAYGGDATQKMAILDRVKSHWAPFNVEIVDARPADGPYVMAVVSPTSPWGAGVGGIAPQDCDNTQPNNIAFAVATPATDPLEVATTISSRIGSTFGVWNSAINSDLAGTSATKTATWTDECLPVDQPPSGCTAQAKAHCATADEQNSARILLDQLGLP